MDLVTITVTTPAGYTFRNTVGTLLTDSWYSPNWGAVNWLLNNEAGKSVADIQEAIWFLLNGAYNTDTWISPSPGVAALVLAALGHNSFVPAAGQVIGVLADGGDGLKNNHLDLQSLLIEVTVPSGTGCPATQGFWHKASRWPNSSTFVDGVTYNGAPTRAW